MDLKPIFNFLSKKELRSLINSTEKKRLFTAFSFTGAFVLIVVQISLALNLFSNKSKIEPNEVVAYAQEDNRDTNVIKDEINKQNQELAPNISNKELEAKNFKNSQAHTDADKARLENLKPIESGEIVLKTKSGDNLDTKALIEKIRLPDATITNVANVPGYYVLKSPSLKAEFDNQWSRLSDKEKEKLKSPSAAFNLLPGNSNILKQLTDTNLFQIASPNPTFSVDYIPNDPDFNKQWGLNNTNLSYNSTIPNDINYPESLDLGLDCSNIKIAVVDTGVSYTHPDLKDRISGLTPDFPKGYNAINNSADANDDYYHGTHVAGIIAAQTDNNEGVSGICPNAKIIPIKVLDSNGSGTFTSIFSGLNYAVDNGADVINMSLGGILPTQDPSYTPIISEFQSLITKAKNKGITVVVAAGNNGQNLDDTSSQITLPAGLNDLITVGASDQDDFLAYFSNYGKKVEISAPGVNIYSTLPSAYFAGEHEGYGNLSGTSMASPMVAGSVGLLKSKNPSLSLAQITKILQDGSKKTAFLSQYTASGRLDLSKSLIKVSKPNSKLFAFDDYISTFSSEPVKVNILDNDLVELPISDYHIQFESPKNGTIKNDPTNGYKTILYTPNSGFTGTDYFKYVLATTKGEKSVGIVSVNVKAFAEMKPPETKNLKINVKSGNQKTIIDFSKYIKTYGSPFDSNFLYLEEFLKLPQSTLTPTSVAGVYIYQNTNPNLVAGKTYYDQLAYSYNDNSWFASNKAYINFEITKGNFAPEYNGQTYFMLGTNSPLQVDVLNSSHDPENDPISIKSATISSSYAQNSGGKIEIVNNKILYTPSSDSSYSYETAKIVITDDRGAETTFGLSFDYNTLYSGGASLPKPKGQAGGGQPPSYYPHAIERSVYETETLSIPAFDFIGASSCYDMNSLFQTSTISKLPSNGNVTMKKVNDSSCLGYSYYFDFTANDLPGSDSTTQDSFDVTLGDGSNQVINISLDIFDKSQTSKIISKNPAPINIKTGSENITSQYLPFNNIFQDPVPTLVDSSFKLITPPSINGVEVSWEYGNLHINPYNVTFQPNEVKHDSIEFTIEGENSPKSSPIKIGFNLSKGNSSPIANPDFAVVQAKGTTLIDALLNDSDPDNDPISYSYVFNMCFNSSSSSQFSVVNNGGKNYLSYTNKGYSQGSPAVAAGLIDSCNNYVISDDKNSGASANVEVYVNAAPAFLSQTQSVSLNDPTEIDLSSIVLDNFNSYVMQKSDKIATHPDSEIDFDLVKINTQPSSGNLSFDKNTRKFTFTPNSGLTSIDDTAEVEVTDVFGAKSTSKISLTSKKIVPPTTTEDTANVDEMSTANIDVLANDTDSSGNPKINSKIEIISEPKLGVAEIDNATNTIKYTQNKEITNNTTDSLIYDIKDKDGLVSNISTVSIKIKDLPNVLIPPVAKADKYSILEGDSQPLNLIANDTFKNQSTLYLKDLVITAQPQFGVLDKDPKLGTLVYSQTQKLNSNTTDTFKYKLVDSSSQDSNETTVTISIKHTSPVITQTTGNVVSFADSVSRKLKLRSSDGNGNITKDVNLIDSNGADVVIPVNYQFVGKYDFDNNQTEDFLYYDSSTKKIAIWFLDGNKVISSSFLKNNDNSDFVLPKDFQVVSLNDFNSDGKIDLLTYNGLTGEQMVFFLDGNGKVTGKSGILFPGGTTYLTRGWMLVGSFDYNGDNKPDILLYNPNTGEQIVWLLNGVNRFGNAQIVVWTLPNFGKIDLPASIGWRIVGIADFDGDGKQDLLWYNYLNGRTMIYTNVCSSTAATKSDILTNGQATTIGGGWSIAATGDFNKDSKEDLLLQNSSTGEAKVMILDGVNITKSTILTKNGNPANLGKNWLVQSVSK